MDFISENLKRLRKEKKLTQSMLAGEIHTSVGTYQNYEYGYSKVPLDRLILLAEALETTVEYLARNQENKKQYINRKTTSFHERLRWLRENHHLTQKQVAELVGTEEPEYQRYEYGEHIPRLERIFQLADIFGVTMDEMVGRIEK